MDYNNRMQQGRGGRANCGCGCANVCGGCNPCSNTGCHRPTPLPSYPQTPVAPSCGCGSPAPAKPSCGCADPVPARPACGCGNPAPVKPACGCGNPAPAKPSCGCNNMPAGPSCPGPIQPRPLYGGPGPVIAGGNNCRPDPLDGMPLAMAYVPWQRWNDCANFDPDAALNNGTMFKDLRFPFEFAGPGCSSRRGGCL
ncbi:spore coat associated protein CotJA [Anaerolentibacter hominis]|uniref:spore coat associated protein CotJA n=1 Tax=Anaerolentibacter hominis TaxID=3079009 RepID=UPI0031B89202